MVTSLRGTRAGRTG